MARRYSIGGRFSQPDPYGGSYDFSDPQSLNRYAYTKNDPVNFRDPTGMMPNICLDGDNMPVKCPDGGPAGSWVVNVYVSWADKITDSYGADRGLDNGLSSTLRMRPLRDPQNSDHLAAIDVAGAVHAALQVTEKGCWSDQGPWNQDVHLGNRYFATVTNAEKYTTGWNDVASIHSKGAKESRSLVRVSISGTAAPVLNAVVGFSYVLKYYPGEGMAVTTNTDSARHWASAPGYATGLDPNVNVRTAKEFMEVAPKCK